MDVVAKPGALTHQARPISSSRCGWISYYNAITMMLRFEKSGRGPPPSSPARTRLAPPRLAESESR
jgi:hypothetical protein